MSKGTRTHTQNIPSGARGAPWLAGPLPLLQATPDLGAGRAMDRLPSAAGSEGALRVRHQSVSLQKNMEHLGKKGGGAGRCLYVFFPVIALLDIFPIFVGMNTRYWLWGVCNHSYVYFAARSIDDP